ncbi:hypothetical protein [Flavobacterium notoginsengisoli]|uniref:hypothetical protein n=1 Tax=Flavobacterium notoginsengisoli TaxID=1478199 RepID=UPI00363B8A13
MKLKCILFLLSIFFLNNSFACECPPHKKETLVKKGLRYADIVFYGELIKIDTIQNTYDFRIIELFKGEYQSKIIHGKRRENNCEINPFKKDLWIVYAKLNRNKTINLSYCSPSQTMEIPPGFLPPVPIVKNYYEKITKIDSLENDILNLKIKNETLTTFFYQLEQLRAYKKDEIEIIEKEKTNDKLETCDQYIIISLVVNIVLLLSLIFIIFKKKNFSK